MAIIKFTLPRLRRFQELRNGHPASMSDGEWEIIINRIIWAMEQLLEDDWLLHLSDAGKDKVQEGLDLFGKHFRSLWW